MKTQVTVERVYEVENAPPKVVLGKIIQLKPDGAKLLKQIDTLTKTPIKNQGECDAVNVGIGKLKKLVKFIDDMRKGFTEPWRTATSETNDKCNAAAQPLKDVIAQGATTVRVWDDEQDRLQREAEEKARKEQEAAEEAARKREEHNRNISLGKGGTGKVAPVVPAPVQRIVPYSAVRSTTYRKNWTYEVTNFNKVPDKYKIIDGQAVKAAMDKDKDGDPTAKIPGIKWICEKVRIR